MLLSRDSRPVTVTSVNSVFMQMSLSSFLRLKKNKVFLCRFLTWTSFFHRFFIVYTRRFSARLNIVIFMRLLRSLPDLTTGWRVYTYLKKNTQSWIFDWQKAEEYEKIWKWYKSYYMDLKIFKYFNQTLKWNREIYSENVGNRYKNIRMWTVIY